MGKFMRSPSKVWWDDNSVSWRSVSANSGSQDSGFSDTETSPGAQQAKASEKSNIEKSIEKGEPSKDEMNQQNLSTNIKEKETPQKNLDFAMHRGGSLHCTPQRFTRMSPISNTAPMGRFQKKLHSQKVSRSLFSNNIAINNNNVNVSPHQYSKQITSLGTRENLNNSEDNVRSYSNDTSLHNDSIELPPSVKSLSPTTNTSRVETWPANLSAPAVLCEEEGSTSFSNYSADSDSELECLFQQNSPKHTSTPKSHQRRSDNLSFRRKFAMNLLLKHQQQERSSAVSPVNLQLQEAQRDLQQWIKETRLSYEPECMTALQCKSIAGELAEKVNQLAGALTLTLRDLINYNTVIENEFETLKNHKKYMKPLIQSLCGIITEFLKKYPNEHNPTLSQHCEHIKNAEELDISKLLPKFYIVYKTLHQKILAKEVKKFMNDLEDPYSEIHVRAMLTGLTSMALRNEELVSLFSKEGAVETLVILCEKCDGSSIRASILRGLSTICCNAAAIRQFEKVSGVQIIVDTLVDESRPEPERSEAVALLAQITAPWIDDNHTVRGLNNSDKKLVKAITKFIYNTKCCQNLLLCSAALANLTTMNGDCIRFILYYNTVDILLKAVKKRGPRASVYLLEQVAILLANVSVVEEARKLLTRNDAPAALLCFLQTSCMDDDIIKRVQQKSMVALSRLCSEPEAAQQVVSLGGIDRLIHLCREKDERCNSDAVLVAALVTLRKIIDRCGTSVMSSQDAQELIEPRLLDSFLAYSTQNESYV